MKKEEIMMKHCSDNGLLNMRLGKSILAAMEEYAEQQLKNCNLQNVSVSLLERAYGLVGHPCTNISAATDLACEQWRNDYERWRNER